MGNLKLYAAVLGVLLTAAAGCNPYVMESMSSSSGDTPTFHLAESTGGISTAPAEAGIIPRRYTSPLLLTYDTSRNRSKGGTPSNTIVIPLSGTVGVTIDWGNAAANASCPRNVQSSGSVSCAYSQAGIYTVSILGPLTHFGNDNDGEGIGAEGGRLIGISAWGDSGIVSLRNAFCHENNLATLPPDLPGTIEDLSHAFQNNTGFTADITGWDVSKVKDMSFLFYGATNFNQDISSWNTLKVTDMSSMFYGATAFNADIGKWDVSKVTSMDSMFLGATAFNRDIGSWDVSNVTDMSFMFFSATSFNQSLSGWNVSNVTDMSFMFAGAMAFNQDISGWDVSNVTNMSGMFSNAVSFNRNLSKWCVKHINSEPGWFEDGALAWSAGKPSWGAAACGTP